MKRNTPLKRKSKSPTALLKDEIQAIARQIVIARDGGCIFRGHPALSPCNGYKKDGTLILQADHLVTRSNSATYADTRLIVCLCQGHHGWKSLGGNLRKAQYDTLVKEIFQNEAPDRLALWERAEKDSWKPHRNYHYDWQLELAALKQELASYH